MEFPGFADVGREAAFRELCCSSQSVSRQASFSKDTVLDVGGNHLRIALRFLGLSFPKDIVETATFESPVLPPLVVPLLETARELSQVIDSANDRNVSANRISNFWSRVP